jgi:hypothetical protein
MFGESNHCVGVGCVYHSLIYHTVAICCLQKKKKLSMIHTIVLLLPFLKVALGTLANDIHRTKMWCQLRGRGLRLTWNVTKPHIRLPVKYPKCCRIH